MTGKGAMTVSEMGRLGGRARAKSTTSRQRKRWAALGGTARAERYTAEELRAFAQSAGRRPKLSLSEERRILALIGDGWTHPRVAAKFGISLRTVGRIVRRNRPGGGA
jgi:DNA-binding NarL/FixJ family response regulator